MEVLLAGPGDYLPNVCRSAVARANELCSDVQFLFNGVKVIVRPGQTTDEIEADFHRRMEAKAAAYRASPAGRKAAEVAKDHLDSCQHEHDILTSMSIATLSEAALIDWLDRYADATDHIGVKGIDLNAIAEALEAAGYKRNDACGLPEAEYQTRCVMARYVIGQAIDCLRSGMPPHPVTHKFIDEYRRLPPVASTTPD